MDNNLISRNLEEAQKFCKKFEAMKKTVIILSVLAIIASSCTQATKKQAKTENNETVNEENGATDNPKNATNKLNENYQHYFRFFGGLLEEEYYSNTDCIGLGVVNPKDFHFQLITDTTSMQKIEIENIKEQEFLIPLFWKPDYGIFYMTVVGISENWYEVRANTEMTVWVNKNEFDFYTWENLLKDQTTCIIADIVYKEKNIHSESADMGEYEATALIVEKVEGDWIFVKGEHLHIEDTVFDYSWVRWKDENNKLLIRPIFNVNSQ